MGGISSMLGEKVAQKVKESTIETVERFNIAEATKNATDTISRMIHNAGPLEIKVSLDVSPNLQELTEKFMLALPLMLLLALIVLIALWNLVSLRCQRSSSIDGRIEKELSTKV